MLQSPTNVTIRANNGQGNVEIHGKTKITQAEIGILVSPVISNIQTQIAHIQKKKIIIIQHIIQYIIQHIQQ